MTPTKLDLCNDTLKAPQGTEIGDLPILREANTVTSFWTLTPDEIRRVSYGQPIVLSVFGATHPPLGLGVLMGEQPEMQDRPTEPSNDTEDPEQWSKVAQWEALRADIADGSAAALRAELDAVKAEFEARNADYLHVVEKLDAHDAIEARRVIDGLLKDRIAIAKARSTVRKAILASGDEFEELVAAYHRAYDGAERWRTIARQAVAGKALDLGEIRERAVHRVLLERVRQDDKWGEQNHDAITWSAILTEECGEFAQAALQRKFGGPAADGLLNEAIQCAAVALQIVEWIDRNRL